MRERSMSSSAPLAMRLRGSCPPCDAMEPSPTTPTGVCTHDSSSNNWVQRGATPDSWHSARPAAAEQLGVSCRTPGSWARVRRPDQEFVAVNYNQSPVEGHLPSVATPASWCNDSPVWRFDAQLHCTPPSFAGSAARSANSSVGPANGSASQSWRMG